MFYYDAAPGEVVKWLKQAGDAVQDGEPLVEVETDKAINEIEAPASGILARIVTPVGTVVKMGGQLGIISPQA